MHCAFENGIKVLEWKRKFETFHTVFQAELMGLKEANIRASQENEITKIWTDSLSSVMAVLDPPYPSSTRPRHPVPSHTESKYSG
ncbi:hypothetical protein AVEN_38259-1 [Araneus ventricosus]|uniref:RNase H type-1 domain-containing protein n=1 Tax=Araneus ventricosus TaxID=182803 RepID=A0A4Y2TMS6_ARAVE|nr:hypothetical protein AVEN_38259-1 [Araneus ventricosus]